MIQTKLIAQIAGSACVVAAVWFGGMVSARAEKPQVSSGPLGSPRPMPVLGEGGGFVGGPAAVAVDDQFLYIVRGGEVVKLYKTNLTQAASAELPPVRHGNGFRSLPSPGGFGGGGTPGPKQNL